MKKTPGNMQVTRRTLIAGGLGLAAGVSSLPRAALANMMPRQLPPRLATLAMAALERHRGSFSASDRIGIADFSQPSRVPRFHILDMNTGESRSLLVAHGRGSDPSHSGWLRSFSNEPGSNATSAGAYLTAAYYTGSHGSSRRLIGLDPENDNAEDRAIVIHPAWYANPEIVRQQGKLGRSEGCFAFAERDIDLVLSQLGEGRMIYANRV